jgi:hypothetical protein
MLTSLPPVDPAFHDDTRVVGLVTVGVALVTVGTVRVTVVRVATAPAGGERERGKERSKGQGRSPGLEPHTVSVGSSRRCEITRSGRTDHGSVRERAGGGAAAEIAQAQALLDRGAITATEYEAIKQKALA